MTQAPDIERERSPWWVTDDELIGIMNVPADIASVAIRQLDAKPTSGFPPKEKLWGNRRFLPAVAAYFHLVYGLKLQTGAARVAPESPGRSGPPRRTLAAPLRKVTYP